MTRPIFLQCIGREARARRLSNVAAPDALCVGASDLGVVLAGEDVGVASLAVVGPALGHISADAVQAGHVGPLAEPATDEDALELVGLSGGEDLAEGAGVELVLHLAVAIIARLEGVGLEGGVLGELGETELGAPGVDCAHVSRVGRWGSRSRARRGLGLRLRLGLGRGRGLGLRRRLWLGLRLRFRRGLRLGLWLGLGGRLGTGVVTRAPTVPVSRSGSRRGLSSVDGLTIGTDDDGDDGSLVDDDGSLRAGSGDGCTREGEHTESSVGVHFGMCVS